MNVGAKLKGVDEEMNESKRNDGVARAKEWDEICD